MTFCIAQNDSSAQEMDAYTLLGISNILENAGHEIEHAYNEIFDEHEAAIKRHMKLRADLAAYLKSAQIPCSAALAKILADDEKEGAQ